MLKLEDIIILPENKDYVAREQRLCTMCNLNDIEDYRRKYFTKIKIFIITKILFI
jgi:hypothetical protein